MASLRTIAMLKSSQAPSQRPPSRTLSRRAGLDALPPSVRDVAATSIQRAFRAHQKRLAFAKQLARRDAAARELLATENTYLFQLKVIQDVFIQPLRFHARNAADPFCTDTQLGAVFGNIEQIYALNCEFAAQLRSRMADFSPLNTVISDIIVRFAPFMRLYLSYMTNYEASRAVLAELLGSEAFRFVLDYASRHPDLRGLTLAALLIVPIQRLPRYGLLLREILRATDESHPDAAGLAHALTVVESVTAFVNSGLKAAESLHQCVTLQAQVSGPCPQLIAPARTFVSSQTLALHPAGEAMVLFLFSDLVMWAQPLVGDPTQSVLYRYKGSATLPELALAAVEATSLAIAPGCVLMLASADARDSLFTAVQSLISADAARQQSLSRSSDASAAGSAAATAGSSPRSRPGSVAVVSAAYLQSADADADADDGDEGLDAAAAAASEAHVTYGALPTLSHPAFAGPLQLRGTGKLGLWHRRHAVLASAFLFVFKAAKPSASARPLLVVPLCGAALTLQDRRKGLPVIALSLASAAPGATPVLVELPSESALLDWTVAIDRVLAPQSPPPHALPLLAALLREPALSMTHDSAAHLLYLAAAAPLPFASALSTAFVALPPTQLVFALAHPHSLAAAQDTLFALARATVDARLSAPAPPTAELTAMALRTLTPRGAAASEPLSLPLCAATAWAVAAAVCEPSALPAARVGVVTPDPLQPFVLVIATALAPAHRALRTATASALAALCSDPFVRREFTAAHVAALVSALAASDATGPDDDALVAAVVTALGRVAQNDSLRSLVSDAGAVPLLAGLLRQAETRNPRPAPRLLLAICEAFRFLVASDALRSVVAAELALPRLVRLLTSTAQPPAVRAAAGQSLALFAASALGRDALLNEGAVPEVVDALRPLVGDAAARPLLTVHLELIAALLGGPRLRAQLVLETLRLSGGVALLRAVAESAIAAATAATSPAVGPDADANAAADNAVLVAAVSALAWATDGSVASRDQVACASLMASCLHLLTDDARPPAVGEATARLLAVLVAARAGMDYLTGDSKALRVLVSRASRGSVLARFHVVRAIRYACNDTAIAGKVAKLAGPDAKALRLHSLMGSVRINTERAVDVERLAMLFRVNVAPRSRRGTVTEPAGVAGLAAAPPAPATADASATTATTTTPTAAATEAAPVVAVEAIVAGPDPVICRVVAKHAYTAGGPTEMSLAQGDVIAVLFKTNADWWYGICGTAEGYFPLAFTAPLVPADADATSAAAAAAAAIVPDAAAAPAQQ